MNWCRFPEDGGILGRVGIVDATGPNDIVGELLGPDVRRPIKHQVFEQVRKTGPSRGLVLGAHVVPDLNVDHGRLVVFHKAGLETVGKGQRSDRRSRQGDGFRLAANPREKEKSDREDDHARLGGLIEDSRQPAPNLKRPSVQGFHSIIEPHKQATYSDLRCRCHLEWDPIRNTSHSRESGNPVRRQRISECWRSGFPLARE